MKTDKELVHRLVVEELAGVISDEDRDLLQRLIRENPEAAGIYKETREILDTPEVHALLADPRPVEEIFMKARKRYRPGFLMMALGFVATVLTCVGVYYLLKPGASAVTPVPVVNQFNPKNIRIQLPDGKTIDLSGQKGAVKAGTVTLNNTSKSLSYTTGKVSTKLARLTVPPGKDYRIRLSDGTMVYLNAMTTLEFPLTFSGNTREVTINGEAYLEVVPSATPFLVHLPGSTVQVLGTAFNVNTYTPGKVQVALVNGAVKMRTEADSLLLKPGYKITYTPSRGMQVSTFDSLGLLSWRQGIHIFNNTPLSEVMEVFPRWFGVEVVMDRPDRKNARFTGVINRNRPMKESLNLLKATNAFDYYIEGETLHIR